MKKTMKTIASLVMMLVLLLGIGAPAYADGIVSYQGGAEKFVFLDDDDLFDNFKGVLPGDVLEQKITVRNAVPRDIYQLELEFATDGSRASSLHDFIVSNGTPCDYFWEIFNGLNVNPPFVNALISASEKSLIEEAQLNHTSVENCRLVYHLGCTAFGDQTKKSRFVLREFGPERRSIFEIPLLYKVSAPLNAAPLNHARDILFAVFEVVENYFSAFIPKVDLDGVLATFFEDQYRLME